MPFEKARITDAPRVDADQGHLSPDEEDELYRYYGLTDGGTRQERTDQVTEAGENTTSADTTGAETGNVGQDASGPTTDDAMTRSEERLKVGKEAVETGRVRLRKHVVAEQQTVQVPVSHEEVTIEREPITDANRVRAEDGPALSEEEHEVVLHEERPVVEKDVVPVERVRLGKETVQDETAVTEEVRKERVEVDGADQGTVDGRIDSTDDGGAGRNR